MVGVAKYWRGRRSNRTATTTSDSAQSVVLLYTSDVRPQYARYVLTATAAPRGTLLRSRYSARWVKPEIWSAWCDGTAVGDRVLICYFEGQRGQGEIMKAVPIRWGIVKAIETYGGYGLLDVEVGSHAGGRHLTELIDGANASGFISPGPQQEILVTRAMLRSATQSNAAEPSDWQATIRALGQFRAFKNASFVYLDTIRDQANGREINPQNCRFPMQVSHTYELKLLTTSPDVRPDMHKYQISFNDKVFEAHGSQTLQLGHSFDVVRFTITANAARTLASRIQVAAIQGAVGPDVEIEAVISTRTVGRALSVAAPGLAAATAASAGVLPSSTPTWIRILLVVAGSAGLAVASRVRR
jgi:hypothetical protein